MNMQNDKQMSLVTIQADFPSIFYSRLYVCRVLPASKSQLLKVQKEKINLNIFKILENNFLKMKHWQRFLCF